MKRWLGGSLLIIWLMVLMLAYFPASWLDRYLADASKGLWRLSDVQGTLWQGSGMLRLQNQDGSVLPMSALAWDWQPKALLQGAMQWAVTSDSQTGQLSAQYDGIKLENLQLQMPVEALTGFSPQWRNARLGGQLTWQAPSWHHGYDGQARSGQISVQWRDATSPLVRVLPFGSYVLDVHADGRQIMLTLNTQQGPLTINGQGTWPNGQAIQLAGQASASAEKYNALKPLLLMLGQPSGEHGVQWKLR